jgi:hypothetical protein
MVPNNNNNTNARQSNGIQTLVLGFCDDGKRLLKPWMMGRFIDMLTLPAVVGRSVGAVHLLHEAQQIQKGQATMMPNEFFVDSPPDNDRESKLL